jgi:lysophospholipase L1-like esterase
MLHKELHPLPFLAFAILISACVIDSTVHAATGDDLLAPFARAHAGEPLSVVAIGTSVSQVGGGWIHPWLKKTFPQSEISVHNAGMSGTGSELAVFRLERDVISRQPDLVMFEFAVNDGNGGARTVWSVESVVRRLKSLENPPAIVMIEAAQRGRDFIPPQRKVAEHYGLLTVDLQAAVKKHLAANKLEWEELLPDGVHPNSAGHAFYRETVAAALQPFAECAARDEMKSAPTPLPPVLSEKPLILDGRLEPVPAAGTWQHADAVPGWWNCFFRGASVCREEGDVLAIPFRGTTVGLFYTFGPRNGMFLASVDGAPPVKIDTGLRDGFGHTLVADGSELGEHLLHVVIPRGGGARDNGVALGYVLIGGGDNCPPGLVPQGACTPEILGQARLDAASEQKLAREKQALFGGVPAERWAWIGPFGNTKERLNPDEESPSDLHKVFWPEPTLGAPPNRTAPSGNPSAEIAWTRDKGKAARLDFERMTGYRDRGVAYAWTVVESAEAQTAHCRLEIDYFGKIWVNGTLVHEVNAGHGGVRQGVWFDLPLKAGRNDLLIKTHAGSAGFSMALSVVPEAAHPLTFTNPVE